MKKQRNSSREWSRYVPHAVKTHATKALVEGRDHKHIKSQHDGTWDVLVDDAHTLQAPFLVHTALRTSWLPLVVP